MDYRFDWFLAPKNLGIFSAFDAEKPSWVWWSTVDNQAIALFTSVDRQTEEGLVELYDLQGRKLFEQHGNIHEMCLPVQQTRNQGIVVINREKILKVQFP
jgi:hypothetical protein